MPCGAPKNLIPGTTFLPPLVMFGNLPVPTSRSIAAARFQPMPVKSGVFDPTQHRPHRTPLLLRFVQRKSPRPRTRTPQTTHNPHIPVQIASAPIITATINTMIPQTRRNRTPRSSRLHSIRASKKGSGVIVFPSAARYH